MSTPESVAYFGYGSLVTSEARPKHTRAHALNLSGWVRQWKHCLDGPFGKACALTVTKRLDSRIDGVLILDRTETIEVTERREIGYRPEPVVIDSSRLPPEYRGIPTHIYVSTPPFYRWGNDSFPILRTYLDCVLAGFLREFGPDGAVRFIQSTEGWGRCPILDDRDAPRYPRKVNLTPSETAQIEELLAGHSIDMAAPTEKPTHGILERN